MFRYSFLPVFLLIGALAGGRPAAAQSADEAALQRTVTAARETAEAGKRLAAALGVELSVIVDTFGYREDASEAVAHLREELAGFGHHHGADEGHHHHGPEEGFNLRHVELGFSANVDPYFYAWVIAAVDVDGAELEEAAIRTTSLPGGFTLQAGKFFSGLGRLNWQHSHDWDFFDQPLVYEAFLGPHGLNDKGLQLTWLAPTACHVIGGVEAFNGDNEKSFHYLGGDELPDHPGPRLWVGWLKVGPDLGEHHAMQLGGSLARGYHQETHDGDADGNADHWLDGHSTLAGADLVYKYKAGREHGLGDVIIQGEYLYRRQALTVVRHDLALPAVGRDKVLDQDGYYVQALYGIAPRWRLGTRWEELGTRNGESLPDGTASDYGASWRAAGLVEWDLSEFSRLRLQAARAGYETADGLETAWEFALQLTVMLGKHPAHSF